MIAKKIWMVNIFCACVACTDPSQEEADTNVDRDADERDVVQDQDTDNPQDAVESQDFDISDRPDATNHDVVDGPDDFQELEDVQDEEVRDTTGPTWDIDEEIRNSTGYQECLAQYNDVVQQALQDLPDMPESEPDDTLDTFTQLSWARTMDAPFTPTDHSIVGETTATDNPSHLPRDALFRWFLATTQAVP